MTPWGWATGYVLAVALLLTALRQLAAPRWWRRWQCRRELRHLAEYRRRIRRTAAHVEAAIRAGHPSAHGEQAGRELAALAVMLVDVDQAIDRQLDQLDAIS